MCRMIVYCPAKKRPKTTPIVPSLQAIGKINLPKPMIYPTSYCDFLQGQSAETERFF